MKPSQYNYIKRMWTRNMSKSNERLLSKIILFPFRITLIVFLTMVYACFIFSFIVFQIIFKIIYEILKFLFNFTINLIINFVKVLKTRKTKTVEITEKPLLYQIKDYIDECGYADICSIQRKFKISYIKTVEIIKEIEFIENK